MSERRAYLHVGTHKTGSTSIQAFVTMNARALAGAGIYVPRTGRPSKRWGSEHIGHHNVAWELNGHDQFRPDEGTFDGLIDEVRGSGARSVLVTSEDLEWLCDKPDTITRVRDAFATLGYATTLVVYLREQAAYFQTLYTENAKAGFLINFAAMLQAALDRGAFVIEHPKAFTSLAYGPFLDAFTAVLGKDRAIVRAYEPAQSPSRLLQQFLADAGAGSLPFGGLLRPTALNPSPTLAIVLNGLYKTVAGSNPAAEPPVTIVARTLDESERNVVDRRFDALTPAEANDIAARFAADNARVARDFPGAASLPLVAATRDPRTWDVAAKQRRVLDAAQAAWNITAATK